MTPFKQLFEHDPKNGVYGDCHRTAIGSIFDIPPEQVPHFYENDRSEAEASRLVSEWLAARGMTQILVPVGASIGTADNVREVLWSAPPERYQSES